MFQVKKRVKFFSKVFFLIFLLIMPAIHGLAASPLKVRYHNKTVTFTKQQVGVKLDNKTIDMDKTPGLELANKAGDDIYMVSAVDVFQKGLKASYSLSKNKIVIKKNDKEIKMTVGSTTAYVNGVKKKLPFAPTNVNYLGVKKTKLLVPAQFVTTNLGYGYSWKNSSKTSATIYITSPYTVYYDNQWRVYNSTLGNAVFDGEDIDVSAMKGIIIDNIAMVQAKTVFADSTINASYKYNSEEDTVVLKKGENTIEMTLGSTTAFVNDTEKTMSAAPRLVTNGLTKKKYVMVPCSFVATNLGYSYTWNGSTKSSVIEKKNFSYFDWYVGDDFTIPVNTNTVIPTKEPVVTDNSSDMNHDVLFPTQSPVPSSDTNEEFPNQQEYNYILRLSGDYEEGRDVVTLQTSGSLENASITEDTDNIYITIPDSINSLENQDSLIEDGITITEVILENDQFVTTITISRVPDGEYTIEKSDTEWRIVFGKTGTSGSNKIKIAIDCGHGINTAGKRTPPMPFDIDFDQDGVIDIKKGQPIKEHIGDVGVGKLLAEELRRCGFEVYESAFGDEDVPLKTRQANIKNAGSDYSISVHFNAAGDGKSFNNASGVEAYYYKTPADAGDSKKFAQIVLNRMKEGTPQISRGVIGTHSYAMCNTTAMNTKASILVECAFMTNLNEATNMMGNADFWLETAKDIAKGVCDYTGVLYVEE